MGRVVRSESTKATLFVMVGLPASGKTTRAKEIGEAERAMRLTPDEWMNPLFGDPEGGRRETLEGRFIWLVIRALRLGINVGASCELVYQEIDEVRQRFRHTRRFSTEPGTTFPMSDDDLRTFREQIEESDEADFLHPKSARHRSDMPPGAHRSLSVGLHRCYRRDGEGH
jgi:hypothetical protein